MRDVSSANMYSGAGSGMAGMAAPYQSAEIWAVSGKSLKLLPPDVRFKG